MHAVHPFTFICCSICLCEFAGTMSFTSPPIAHILRTVSMSKGSLSMLQIFFPVALIICSIWPCLDTKPFPLFSLPLSFIFDPTFFPYLFSFYAVCVILRMIFWSRVAPIIIVFAVIKTISTPLSPDLPISLTLGDKEGTLYWILFRLVSEVKLLRLFIQWLVILPLLNDIAA